MVRVAFCVGCAATCRPEITRASILQEKSAPRRYACNPYERLLIIDQVEPAAVGFSDIRAALRLWSFCCSLSVNIEFQPLGIGSAASRCNRAGAGGVRPVWLSIICFSRGVRPFESYGIFTRRNCARRFARSGTTPSLLDDRAGRLTTAQHAAAPDGAGGI